MTFEIPSSLAKTAAIQIVREAIEIGLQNGIRLPARLEVRGANGLELDVRVSINSGGTSEFHIQRASGDLTPESAPLSIDMRPESGEGPSYTGSVERISLLH